ncbi:MAG: RNA 2',3'-cyclic phosphodiesterase [Syntrophomonadaceae bacterium]|jgi:2'-5' RNA ligase
MRAFLAIPVSEEIKKYASEVRYDLAVCNPDIKWVEENNYHLTVKFLGNIDNHIIPEIKKAMAIVGENCPPFELNIGGIGFFPNKFRPRVVWLGVDGEVNKAEFLASRVDDYLHPLGFELDKTHRFHLTLGRIRSEHNISKMMDRAARLSNRKLDLLVHEFCLMESSLTPFGPVYRIIDKFTING